MRDLALAILEAGLLDDQVDRRGDLLADDLERHIHTRHHRHRLHTRDRVTRRVGVQGRQGAVVAGVHRLEHIHRLTAAALADHHSFGAHTQRVDHQVANRDATAAIRFGWFGLEAHDVLLRQL